MRRLHGDSRYAAVPMYLSVQGESLAQVHRSFLTLFLSGRRSKSAEEGREACPGRLEVWC